MKDDQESDEGGEGEIYDNDESQIQLQINAQRLQDSAVVIEYSFRSA